jgi:hypothetical protein
MMSNSKQKAGWLIEAEMFPDYCDQLVRRVNEAGHIAKLVPALKFGYRWDELDSPYLQLFPRDSCVIFHGSMELAIRLQSQKPWIPGSYCKWEHLDCSVYYCHFSDHLLNNDYVMLPFGELLRCKELLFDTLGIEGAIFVRPNSCQKSFTGQPAHWESFEKDVEFMAFYDVPPHALVIVSSPKQITHEWRYVVADGRAVSGSLYKHNGTLEKRPETDPAADRLAQLLASHVFQPDRVWTADICRTAEGDYRLLEIGGLSCADLYLCDLTAVVRAVSNVAVADWEMARVNAPDRPTDAVTLP